MEMKKAGYLTAMIGKWHLEAEPATFDYYCVLPGQGKYFNPDFIVRGDQPWPKNKIQREGHSSDVITDLTLDWLEKRDKTKPFFLMHHYKAPHDMFEHAPRYNDYLKDVDVPEPENLYGQPLAGFGSVATRGTNDSLVRRIGTSISKRHPVRNYGIDFNIDPNLSRQGIHAPGVSGIPQALPALRERRGRQPRAALRLLEENGPARQHDHHLHERPGNDARRARLHGQTLDV